PAELEEDRCAGGSGQDRLHDHAARGGVEISQVHSVRSPYGKRAHPRAGCGTVGGFRGPAEGCHGQAEDDITRKPGVRRRRFRYNGAMDIEIRPMTPEHGDQFTRVMATAFGEEFTEEEVADHDRWFEYDRSIGAFDGDRLVGTGGAYSMDLTLPGLTTIPIGGLTAIGVLPTYRRRGILRSMIDYHFQEVEGRGELVSGLGASESVIYGRFGYGLATTDASYEIDPRRAQFLRQPTGTGRLRLLDPEETAKVVPPLYDRYPRGQPGARTRPQAWWDVCARD